MTSAQILIRLDYRATAKTRISGADERVLPRPDPMSQLVQLLAPLQHCPACLELEGAILDNESPL